jgi:quercetin dioxygenase-like cupin family protein
VLGSEALLRSLMPHRLVDEFLLTIHSLVLGVGRRAVSVEGPRLVLQLIDTKPTTVSSSLGTSWPNPPLLPTRIDVVHPLTSSSSSGDTMQILPEQPTIKGPSDWFTGDVYIDPIARGQEPSRIQVSVVRFTPGARSAWHAYGMGQTLYVTDGVGRIQSRGEDVHEIRAGDVIVTPPGEEHWHGAAADQYMAHISMTEFVADKPDRWGAHVTDDEYHNR